MYHCKFKELLELYNAAHIIMHISPSKKCHYNTLTPHFCCIITPPLGNQSWQAATLLHMPRPWKHPVMQVHCCLLLLTAGTLYPTTTISILHLWRSAIKFLCCQAGQHWCSSQGSCVGLNNGANAGMYAVYSLQVVMTRLLSLSRGGSTGICAGRS